MKQEEFKSRVYTDRPPYADFEAPQKFQAIQAIVGKHLKEHPNAICSYSGGADSDILIDVIERARELFQLPKVDYVFFNTGLEMDATKRHLDETEKKYGVTISRERPKTGIFNCDGGLQWPSNSTWLCWTRNATWHSTPTGTASA